MTEPAENGLDVLVEHVEIVTVNQRTYFLTNDFSTKGHVTSQPQPPLTLKDRFFSSVIMSSS